MCRGEDIGGAILSGIIDQSTRACARPSDDEKDDTSGLLPRLGMCDDVRCTVKGFEASPRMIIEGLSRLSKGRRLASTAKLSEAVEGSF